MRNFEEKCPLLYSVLQNLLVPDQMHVEEFTKLLNTSQNVELMHWHYFLVFATGNSTMIFGFYLVCCAFDMELENRFVNMLNTIGLSSHWDTMYVKTFCAFVYRLFASVFGKSTPLAANMPRCVNFSVIILFNDTQ
jgi:hypothetical protein